MATVHSRTFGGTEGTMAKGVVQGPEPIKTDLDYALGSLNPTATLPDSTEGGITTDNLNATFLATLIRTLNSIACDSSGNLTLAGGTGITISTDAASNTVTITATGGVAPAAHASTHNTGGADPLTGNVPGNAATATTATNQSGGTVAATTGSFSGQITSTVADGTAPLVVTSTTKVNNLYVARAALADSATSVSTASLAFGFFYPATDDMSPYYKFAKAKTLTSIQVLRHTSTTSAVTFGLYLSTGTLIGSVTVAAAASSGSTTVSYSFSTDDIIYVKCTTGDSASIATVELVFS